MPSPLPPLLDAVCWLSTVLFPLSLELPQRSDTAFVFFFSAAAYNLPSIKTFCALQLLQTQHPICYDLPGPPDCSKLPLPMLLFDLLLERSAADCASVARRPCAIHVPTAAGPEFIKC